METIQQTMFRDPGADFGVDIDRGNFIVTAARRWPIHEVASDSPAWPVLRAYGPPKAVLKGMTPGELWECLVSLEPALKFRTPRPEWATETISTEADGWHVCTHERPFLVRPALRLVLSQTDYLTPDGEVETGRTEVVLDVGSADGWARTSLTPPLLQALGVASTAAANHLTRVLTATFR